MGGSGLESTNDFQKIYGSGLDRIPIFSDQDWTWTEISQSAHLWLVVCSMLPWAWWHVFIDLKMPKVNFLLEAILFLQTKRFQAHLSVCINANVCTLERTHERGN